MGQPKWLIGTASLFVVAAIICYALEGQWMGSETSNLTKAMNGWFSFSGALYAAKAFWQTLTWNFSYLQSGVGAYIRLFPLSIISLALAFELFVIAARLVIPWAR